MKKESCAALKKKLDNVFSLYVRHRDAGRCYTCGVQRMPSEMQAGHYISRTHLVLRWDEMNVKCQCPKCNLFMQGNSVSFREHLVSEYGDAAVKHLEERRHESVKLNPEWYHRMIDHYAERLKVYRE
jgi:hypothetical protein